MVGYQSAHVGTATYPFFYCCPYRETFKMAILRVVQMHVGQGCERKSSQSGQKRVSSYKRVRMH